MTKKTMSIMAACAVALGLTTTLVPTQVSAASTLNTTTTVQRSSNQSMLLSMHDVANAFLTKYPDSAIHSIELKPNKGQFNYKVEGYTLKNTYSMNVDVITGKITKEEKGGKEKNLTAKIFNPSQVIEPQAAQAAAVAAVGQGSIAKGWELEAENNQVTYEVEVHQNGQEVDVTLDAKDGSIISVSKPEPIDD